MTDTLRHAAHSTTYILDTADRVRQLLSRYGEPRRNSVGVLANPAAYLSAMQAAQDELDRAIAMHKSTNWPDASDYHAL